MRTGIYVYASTTLTVTASESVTLTELNTTHSVAVDASGRAAVAAGVYKVLTSKCIGVSCESSVDLDIVVVTNNKDPFPVPPLRAKTLLGVSDTSIGSFFNTTNTKSAAF
jgi:hypothetical protein